MKKLPKYFKIFSFLLILIIAFMSIYSLSNRDKPEINRYNIPVAATIDYPAEFNYRQTVNDCGPFNVAAVVRAVTGELVDSAEFAENISWRLPNKYTLPWGMEKQFKDNKIAIETPDVSALSDEDKIFFLQQQLSAKNPIIILGERDNYEHYITVFAFDRVKDEFYIYDSLFDKGDDGLTLDSNDDFPGNRTFSSEELLQFWRGGGMYGIYNWYLIVAHNE